LNAGRAVTLRAATIESSRLRVAIVYTRSLVVAAAVTKFTTQTVSDAQMAEVRAAKAEWDATMQVVAARQD
jgi:hypothetical protein